MGRSALIAGGTGLVGGHCLRRLLDSDCYDRVIAIGRRSPGFSHPKLEEHLVDFERLEEAEMPTVDDVFCAIGTTIRTAGSRDAFRRVDHDYVVTLAQRTSTAGARQFLLVSSTGADVESRFFYYRVKGETERDVSGMPFHGIHFFRPSLLLGNRPESRPLERAGIMLVRPVVQLFRGPLRRYRPVDADAVAATMVVSALRGCSGVRIVGNERMLGG